MKRLLLILILTLSFQTLSKANDIRDFQIEGMSIGDSALDFFTKLEIKKNEQKYYNNNEIVPIYFEDKLRFSNYDGVQFHYRRNDKKFRFISIAGIIIMGDKKLKDCQKKQKKVDEEIKYIFSDLKRENLGVVKHPQDKSGKSKFAGIQYKFKSKDIINITCYYWDKKMSYPTNFRVGVGTEKFHLWINNKAYK